jgi:hypothetical protein
MGMWDLLAMLEWHIGQGVWTCIAAALHSGNMIYVGVLVKLPVHMSGSKLQAGTGSGNKNLVLSLAFPLWEVEMGGGPCHQPQLCGPSVACV